MRHDRFSSEQMRKTGSFREDHADTMRADLRFGAPHRRRLIAEAEPTKPPQTAVALDETRQAWHRAVTRQVLILIALTGLAVLLRDRLLALDVAAIMAGLQTVTAPQWAIALLATAISYWSLGQYDAAIHRALNTGMSARAASTAGAAAIAISQTVGFGLVSGALVRWRLSPGLSLVQASKITAIVALSFLVGWAGVTGAVLLALPVEMAGARALGLLGVGLGISALTLSLAMPKLTFMGREFSLPSTGLMTRIAALAALDTIAAGLALWILLPPGTGLAFAVLLPAFMLALGAGFVAGTPAGVGPFEITLLALLPVGAANAAEPTAILAAVLAWRGVYFALPAVMAGLAIAFGALTQPRNLTAQKADPTTAVPPAHMPLPNAQTTLKSMTARAVAPPATELTPRLKALIERAPRAELGLLRQGEHSVLLAGNARAGWMIGQARQTLIGLLDPFGAPERGLAAALLPRLTELARTQGRIPCLYKVNARTAATARTLGWSVAPVAREAWLPALTFDLNTPARSGLRRKLRKAQKSGVRVSNAEGALPIHEMTEISDAWVKSRGAERGFSMGRYTPEYASAQRVYLAHCGDELVAFATFHEGATEWVLDLMRPRDDAPDGTMHALICAAIGDAKAFGIPRLSLAALPPEADQTSGPAAIVWRRAEAQKGAAGLKQFKSAFAPEWQTLYIAARGTARLTVAAADIAHAIRRPPPFAYKMNETEPAREARHHTADQWSRLMTTNMMTTDHAAHRAGGAPEGNPPPRPAKKGASKTNKS